MSRFGLPLLLLPLLLPACSAEPPEELVVSDDDHADSQHLLSPGEYRIAGADGAEVNLPHAITVSVTQSNIAVVSQCVTPKWTYHYSEGALTTEPIVEAMCDRGRYPQEIAVMAVFDEPDTVLRTPTNGLYLEGGGHNITLFSQ